MPFYEPRPPSQTTRRFVGEAPVPAPKQIRSETRLGSLLAAERSGMRSETSVFAPFAQGEITGIDKGEYVTTLQRVSSLTDSYYVRTLQFAVDDDLLITVEGDFEGLFRPTTQSETQTVSREASETAQYFAQTETTALTVEAAPVDEPQIVFEESPEGETTLTSEEFEGRSVIFDPVPTEGGEFFG